MPRAVLGFVLLAACGSHSGTPAAGIANSSATPAKVASASSPADLAQVEADLRLIIGGSFEVDHIGPAAHDEVLQRARAHAALYLDVLVEQVVGPHPDAAWLSNVYAPYPIELLQTDAPDSAADAAARLLPLHEAAQQASTPSLADDPHRAYRLGQRVASLRALTRP